MWTYRWCVVLPFLLTVLVACGGAGSSVPTATSITAPVTATPVPPPASTTILPPNPQPTATPTMVLPPTATPLVTLAPPTSFTNWKDRDGRVQLRYPADWAVATQPSDLSQAALFVRGKTAEITFAVILMPQRGTDADAIADASLCRNRLPSCSAYQYSYEPVENVTVGGVAGKFRRYSSFYRSDAVGSNATRAPSGGATTELVWVVSRSGQTFVFHASYFGEGRKCRRRNAGSPVIVILLANPSGSCG